MVIDARACSAETSSCDGSWLLALAFLLPVARCSFDDGVTRGAPTMPDLLRPHAEQGSNRAQAGSASG